MFDREVLLEIYKSKLFWFATALKVVLAAFFASNFLTEFFLPFVDFYLNNNFQNPYDYFFLAGKNDSFPYPPLMLWLVALPYGALFFILKTLGISSIFATILTFRISVFVADLLILIVLAKWLKHKTKKLLIFYWLSPVLIYINYVHGQLDCIPIAILILSLYFLFKEKFILSCVILAAAISCKTNIILAAPFLAIYLYSKKIAPKKLALCALAFVATLCVINAPYVSSQGFIHMVLLNSKQAQIFDAFYPYYLGRLFYLVPGIYLILLVKALVIKGYNRDIFIMFLGFTFGVLNLFIPPMQGWYYWVIPFFAYFCIKQKDAPSFLFFSLQIFYFAYFAAIKNSDFLQVFQFIAPDFLNHPNLYSFAAISGFNPNKIANLSFTFLQVSLFLNCLWIYRSGISNYLKHKLISKPYLIGVSGDSGVGKSTLVASCVNIFGANNVTTLCGDDMHKWERGHKKWQEFTHLNPSANKLHGEVAFLNALKNGQKISRIIYDHDNGKFTEPKNIAAKKIVILEGLHSFYVKSVRKIFDVRIFIKPEKQLQMHWKIIRDQEKRGYSKEKILELLKIRETDSEKFILSQEKYADVKIELLPLCPIKNLGDKNENVELILKISCDNNIDVEPLLASLYEIKDLNVEHEFNENDAQIIKMNGRASKEEIKKCGDNLLSQSFEEIGLQEPLWSGDITGLTQLFMAFYIIQTEMSDETKNI